MEVTSVFRRTATRDRALGPEFSEGVLLLGPNNKNVFVA